MEDISTIFYNHMPPHESFHPIPDEQNPPHENYGFSPHPNSKEPYHSQKPPGSDLLGELAGGLQDTLGQVFKDFSLKNLDSGDILLLLIILFLFTKDDHLDLIIALGLMFLLNFGKDPQPST